MPTASLRLPTVQLAGLYHLPRMVDKIRLSQAGTLAADYVLGEGDGTCLDGRICRFFNVPYAEFRGHVETGASDEEIATWFAGHAKDFTPERILIINQFLSKRGFRDESTPGLEKWKLNHGFANRNDIQTWFDSIIAEEQPEALPGTEP